ncbi:outer kinetochore KNL1 complex subunit ZWINT isoform X1 [Lithobates pipiens]
MAEAAQRILDSIASKPHLNIYQKEEGDEVAAKVLVHYSKKRCKKQRILCNQLQVLRFLLEFLQEASTVSWEESNPELLNEEREMVRQKWKGLKSEYLNKVKEVEELLPQLLEKIQLLQEKKNQLEASLQRYQDKRATMEKQAKQELEEALQKQQQVVQKCQDHIEKLKVEVEKLEQSAESWIQSVNKDSSLLELLRTLQGMSLVSVEDKEMVLDLYAGETAVAPLRINVHLTSEQFHIKTEDSMPGLPPELQHGATSHITSVILELQCWYRNHGQLLAEMRVLQDRFSIDWLPVERQVLLLKDSKQYTLYVEPGYPQSGRVKLLSVKESEMGASSSNLKPPGEYPSLTTWLEYLQTLHQLGR